MDRASGLWGVVEFTSLPPLSAAGSASASSGAAQNVAYRIRLKYTVIPGAGRTTVRHPNHAPRITRSSVGESGRYCCRTAGTDEAFYSYYGGLSTRYKEYITSGFVVLQRAVNEAVRGLLALPSGPRHDGSERRFLLRWL